MRHAPTTRDRVQFSTRRIECPRCQASRGYAPVVDHSQPHGYDPRRGYCHACGVAQGFRGDDTIPEDVRRDMLAKWYTMTTDPAIALRNGLSAYLVNRYGVQVVRPHLERWHVGTDGIGNAVFWYVNGDGEAITCKAVPYDAQTARRRKGDDNRICWHDGHGGVRRADNLFGICTGTYADGTAGVVSFAQRKGFAPPCLYGEWQLSDEARRNDTVLLVEAEKTAVVASLFLPDYIVVATGGAGGLTHAKAQALVGRTVLVIMDQDASGDRGAARAAAILDDVGALAIYDHDGRTLMRDTFPDCPMSWDVADIFLYGDDVPPPIHTGAAYPVVDADGDHGDAWEPPVDTAGFPQSVTVSPKGGL